MGIIRINDLTKVHQHYVKRERLGQGTDGIVTKYERKANKGEYIAVKEPVRLRHSAANAIEQEIAVMKQIGKHENILDMLGLDENWTAHGPGIFYEHCQLGDVTTYPQKLRQKFGYVPEETVWKFFADIAQGLEYLHTLEPPMIHGDLKSDNILVSWPFPLKNSTPPILPTFKIADLSRAVTYMPQQKIISYMGTYEYAPPPSETELGVHPAVDIWGLAASLQSLALGRLPTQSKHKFLEDYKRQHGAYRAPPIKKLDSDEWRRLIPVIWRPLNADADEREEKWDVYEENNVRYSDSLNRWYTACMDADWRTRLDAGDLVRWVVPVAKRRIRVLQAERRLGAARRAVKKGPVPNATLAGARLGVVGKVVARVNKIVGKEAEAKGEVEGRRLRREDFGLKGRRSSDLRRKGEESSDVRALREREQKYLKGVKRKDPVWC